MGKYAAAAWARGRRAPLGVRGRRAAWLLEVSASPHPQVARPVIPLLLWMDSEWHSTLITWVCLRRKGLCVCPGETDVRQRVPRRLEFRGDPRF